MAQIGECTFEREKHPLEPLYSKKGVGLFSKVGLFSRVGLFLVDYSIGLTGPMSGSSVEGERF